MHIRLTPNAPRTRAEGFHNGRLRVRVQAPPVEGKANARTLKWLARAFGVRTTEVVLLRGARARDKDFLIEGVEIDRARAVVTELSH